MTIRLSNRQFAELKLFVGGSYFSYAAMQKLNQCTAWSLWHRGYIEYRTGKGFRITPVGVEAWENYRHTDITRKDPTKPLGRYFDPTAYGLKLELKPRPLAKTA